MKRKRKEVSRVKGQVSSGKVPILVAVLCDVLNDADCLWQTLNLALEKHHEVKKWFRIEVSTTGAKHSVLMISTRRMLSLQAAIHAAAGEDVAVKRSAGAQGAKVVASRIGTKAVHGRKDES